MDANRTRYHALLTANDWTQEVQSQQHHVQWNAKARGLTLQPRLFEFTAAKPGPAPIEETGRGGVFDAYGNLYALSLDRLGITIRSAGSGVITPFWPVESSGQAGVGAVEGLNTGRPSTAGGFQDGGFHPVAPAPTLTDLRLDALTVTTQHYLVVVSAQAGGLLVFDLHGAGPPLLQPWPDMGPVAALVAMPDGGVGALVDNTLVRMGPSLKPCLPNPGPCFIDLSPALPSGGQATAIARDGDWLVVLSQGPSGGLISTDGEVWLGVIGLNGQALTIDEGSPPSAQTIKLNELIGQLAVDGTAPALACRSLALCRLNEQTSGVSIIVVAAAGDQAFRFTGLVSDDGRFELALQSEFWPLRRYEALGLAALPNGVRLHAYPLARLFYASEGRWPPLLKLDRPRYAPSDQLLSPVWDGGIDACVWHRLMLDMRLPSGTQVVLETRTIDGPTPQGIEQQVWRPEPSLIRSARGSEQAWQDFSDADLNAGYASWETLLQAAQGRWFQARLTLSGDGQRTPVLRALRAWYPRFSYAKEYLPPIYREDPSGADFLDRFLALFEGEFTRWEDRIAAAQLLFDARTAPAATLEWLGTWLGLAFDAADIDPVRRRLLIQYAVQGYARRGTVPGMLLACTLAWEPGIEEAWLANPSTLTTRPHGVRLHEFFSRVGTLPRTAWQPALGRMALLTALNLDASLLSSADTPEAAARRALLTSALGFIPRAAEEESRLWTAWQAWASTPAALPLDEPQDDTVLTDWVAYLQASQRCAPLRQRWQDYLARRWRRVSALNEQWGSTWSAFEHIPSPVALPLSEVALADWHRFESQVLRAQAHAHRFRVVLPLPNGPLDLDDLTRRRHTVLRAVGREKPAHTVAEVRFGFDLFRIGDARLGLDTQLEQGLSRRPELLALSRAVLGRTELGSARLAPTRPQAPPDRIGLDRGEPLYR